MARPASFVYRVGLVVCHLDWIDINIGHPTVCLVLHGQMRIGLDRPPAPPCSNLSWWTVCALFVSQPALSPPRLDYLCASHEFRFCHRRRRHRIVVLLPSVFGSEATKSERANGRAKSSLPPSSSNSCIRFRLRIAERTESAYRRDSMMIQSNPSGIFRASTNSIQ